MPSFTGHTPWEILIASAVVFVWLIFFAVGAYFGYDAVRDYYYEIERSQKFDGK